MNTISETLVPVPADTRARAARLAVSVFFFASGGLSASLLSRMPAIQKMHGLSHAELGLGLLAMSVGALAAMPASGQVARRMGTGKLSRMAAAVACAVLPCVALVDSGIGVVLALFLFGAAQGTLGVAMNAHAVVVEQRLATPIISRIHALFSAGGLSAAGVGALAATSKISPLVHLSTVAALLAAATAIAGANLLDDQVRDVPRHRGGIVTDRRLLILAVLGLCAIVGEGAVAGWSAVYLRSELRTSEATAAVGFASFSVAMLAGRSCGDFLSLRFSPGALIRGGGAVAAAGLLAVVLATKPALALAGFAAVGAGLALTVPLTFRAARDVVSVASVATLASVGSLFAPAIIGSISQSFGLRWGLSLIVVTSLTLVLFGAGVKQTPA